MDKTVNGLTFRQWYAKVDTEVQALTGLGVDDFTDWLSHYAWQDEVTPQEGARMCLENDEIGAQMLAL